MQMSTGHPSNLPSLPATISSITMRSYPTKYDLPLAQSRRANSSLPFHASVCHRRSHRAVVGLRLLQSRHPLRPQTCQVQDAVIGLEAELGDFRNSQQPPQDSMEFNQGQRNVWRQPTRTKESRASCGAMNGSDGEDSHTSMSMGSQSRGSTGSLSNARTPKTHS